MLPDAFIDDRMRDTGTIYRNNNAARKLAERSSGAIVKIVNLFVRPEIS